MNCSLLAVFRLYFTQVAIGPASAARKVSAAATSSAGACWPSAVRKVCDES